MIEVASCLSRVDVSSAVQITSGKRCNAESRLHLQMAGEPAQPTDVGGEGRLSGDETDAKPDRRGRFLLFGR